MITKALGARKAPSRVVAALALAAALTTAGCSTMSPVQTDASYQAADGVNLTLGDNLDVRGLVLVGTADEDGPGRLVGQFVNATAKEVEVTFGTQGSEPVSTSVPAGASINLADEDGLTLDKIPGKAGDLVPVTVTTKTTGDNVLTVPVLLAQGPYEDFAPVVSAK